MVCPTPSFITGWPLPFLLASRLQLILQLEQTTSASCPCAPQCLKETSWDQRELRPWMRFALPVNYQVSPSTWPGLRSSCHHLPLRWDNKPSFDPAVYDQKAASVVHHIALLCDQILCQTWGGGPSRRKLLADVAWMTSEPVHQWYQRLESRSRAPAAFSDWVWNLYFTGTTRVASAGPAVALAYTVCLEPHSAVLN